MAARTPSRKTGKPLLLVVWAGLFLCLGLPLRAQVSDPLQRLPTGYNWYGPGPRPQQQPAGPPGVGLSGRRSLHGALPDGTSPLPPDFLRLSVAQSFSLGPVPLRFDGLGSTESRPSFRQPLFYAGFQVDYPKLTQRIQDRLAERLREHEAVVQSYQKSKLDAYNARLERLRKDLPDTSAWHKYQQRLPDSAQALGLSRRRDTLLHLYARTDTLRQRLDSLSHYTTYAGDASQMASLSDSLRRLETRAQGLEGQLAQGLGMLDSVPDAVPDLRARARVDTALQDAELELTPDEYRRFKQKLKNVRDGATHSDLQRLHRLGVLTRGEKHLLGFRRLELGSANPYFSDFSLSGQQLLGFNVEHGEPKRFYWGATAGLRRFAVPAPQPGRPGFDPQAVFQHFYHPSFSGGLAGLTAGIGPQEEKHLHAHLVYGKDFRHSLSNATGPVPSPRQNILAGIDWQYTLRGFPLTVSGEANASALARDTRLERLSRPALADWAQLRNRYDSAYVIQKAGKLNLDWKPDSKTQVLTNLDVAGTGYTTLGVPFLRSGFRRGRLQVTRAFLKGKVIGSGFGGLERTDLPNKPGLGVDSRMGGGTLNLRFPRMPVLTSAYNYMRIKGSGLEGSANPGTLLQNVNLNLSHAYHFGRQAASFNATYAYVSNRAEQPSQSYNTHNLALVNQLGLTNVLKVTARAALQRMIREAKDSTLITVSATLTATFGKWQHAFTPGYGFYLGGGNRWQAVYEGKAALSERVALNWRFEAYLLELRSGSGRWTTGTIGASYNFGKPASERGTNTPPQQP